MTRSEEMDQAVAGDRVGAPLAGLFDASAWVAASRSRSARASARNRGALTGARVLGSSRDHDVDHQYPPSAPAPAVAATGP